jgi:hypothetical protein
MLRTKVSPRGLPASLVAGGLIALGLLVPTAGRAAGRPAATFSQSSYDYGTIDAGTTASKTFTLRNSGGSATGALSVSLTGSSAFSKTADTCTATSLGPKKSCTVTIQYAPTTVGASDTATLSASGNKRGATATPRSPARAPRQRASRSATANCSGARSRRGRVPRSGRATVGHGAARKISRPRQSRWTLTASQRAEPAPQPCRPHRRQSRRTQPVPACSSRRAGQ